MMTRRTTNNAFILLISFMLVGLQASVLIAADFHLVQPDNTGKATSSFMKPPNDPSHYRRRAGIRVPKNLLDLSRTLKVGDRVIISIFDDKHYSIIVRSKKNGTTNRVTITGNIEGEEIQTFTMTIDPDHFLISLQDLKANMSYWVSGKTADANGSVLEANDAKRPPRLD